MRLHAFGNLPFFRALGYGFNGIYEFRPAFSFGLIFILRTGLRIELSFMGLNLEYHVYPFKTHSK